MTVLFRSLAITTAILVLSCGAKTNLLVHDEFESDSDADIGDSNVNDADPDEIDADPDEIDADPDEIDADPDEIDADPDEVDADPDGFDADFDGCPFEDGFETGTERWILGAHWSVTGDAAEGMAALNGFWSLKGAGCPVTQSALMNVDVDLRHARAAELSFLQSGAASHNDTLRIMVSTDGGANWTIVTILHEPPDEMYLEEYETVRVPLDDWLGHSEVRLGFEFNNVCGDPRGVDWFIDEVRVCLDTE